MPVSARIPLALLVLVPACENPADTAADPSNQFPAALQQAAFVVEVNTDGRAAVVDEAAEAPAGVPLLDGAVAQIEITGVGAAVTGEVRPGWRRVIVGIRARNIAAGQLVSPRFEVATPTDRLLLIPLETWAPPTSGDVSVGNGTEVTVELPNRGEVRLAEGWSGKPEAFFSGATRCGAVDTRCRPYEMLPAPLAPGDASDLTQLAFDLEPTVHLFRFRLVLAGAVQ